MPGIGGLFHSAKNWVKPKAHDAKEWAKENPWKTAGGVGAVGLGGYFLFKSDNEGTTA